MSCKETKSSEVTKEAAEKKNSKKSGIAGEKMVVRRRRMGRISLGQELASLAYVDG